MARNSNIIKYGMQLRNDSVDLSGQVTRVTVIGIMSPRYGVDRAGLLIDYVK